MRAQPVLRKHTSGLRACVLRVERSAAGCRFRSGSASLASSSSPVVGAGISVEVAGAAGGSESEEMGRATCVVEGCTGTAGERVSEITVVSRPMREATARAMSMLRSGG
eukprot:6159274-Pleurochrysis_carterae.AAC.1